MTYGYIHSVETCGTVDGPGIRYVVFMQGCSLRCQYCHNPDTWEMQNGTKYLPQELFTDILKYKKFIKNGGVTLSGGEPLLQSEFAYELIELCKQNGIHTALDTSGIIPLDRCKDAIDAADMVLLDIKSIDEAVCKLLTGASNKNALKLLDYLEKTNKSVWIRQVILPGITDNTEHLERLAKHLSKFTVIEKVELIPFHKMGEFKWERLKLDYKLSLIQPPSEQAMDSYRRLFTCVGFNPS